MYLIQKEPIMRIDFPSIVVALVLLLPVLLLLGTGIAAIAFGCYLHFRPGTLWRGQSWQQLLKWRVVTPDTANPGLLEEFARSRDIILSSAMIGMGLALVIVVCSGVALVWTAPWTASGTFVVDIVRQFLAPALFLSYLLGNGLGYLYGVWRLRRLTARGATYGDLQPRELSDYRSVVFPLCAAILIVGVALITLITGPHLRAGVPLFLGDGMTRSVAPAWLLWVLPGAMLLTLSVGEILLGQIARFPRLLLTRHPLTAQRADNLLRALTIGTVQGHELTVIGSLGVVHGILMSNSLWHSGFWQLGSRPWSPLLDTWYWFAAFVAMAGLLLPACAGRIGGRITGWPWRPAQVL
jgi:hypothetical protein